MGLPFSAIVEGRPLAWSDLAGRRIAVDGHNAVYQFLATVRQRDGQPFTDAEGRPTSHLIGIFYRTTAWLAQGIRPIWVFDGRPPDLKAGTLSARFRAKERAEREWKEALEREDLETARRKAAATSRFTQPMAGEARELLGALGIPTVAARSEGEAQAARLTIDGIAWATGSEDYDTLLFGAPRLVRGLSGRTRPGGSGAAQLIEREALLATLGIDTEELLLLGLLVGTDFNDGAKGYGPKRSLQLLRRHLGWEATLRAAGLEPSEVAEAATIFRTPEVAPSAPVEFRPIDRARVEAILVDGRGFDGDRVRAALDRAERPPKNLPSAPPDGRRQSRLDGFGAA